MSAPRFWRVDAAHIGFHCPGCKGGHMVKVEGTPAWGWNGDLVLATITPSIRVRGKRPITDDEAERILAGEKLDIPAFVCHSFVRDGRIEFLNDCTHKLAGQTVDVPTLD